MGRENNRTRLREGLQASPFRGSHSGAWLHCSPFLPSRLSHYIHVSTLWFSWELEKEGNWTYFVCEDISALIRWTSSDIKTNGGESQLEVIFRVFDRGRCAWLLTVNGDGVPLHKSQYIYHLLYSPLNHLCPQSILWTLASLKEGPLFFNGICTDVYIYPVEVALL